MGGVNRRIPSLANFVYHEMENNSKTIGTRFVLEDIEEGESVITSYHKPNCMENINNKSLLHLQTTTTHHELLYHVTLVIFHCCQCHKNVHLHHAFTYSKNVELLSPSPVALW